jgi:muramoyltetrapeptide carboxypeptidase
MEIKKTKVNNTKYNIFKTKKSLLKLKTIKIGLIAPSYWVSKGSREIAIKRLKQIGFSKIDAFKDLFKKELFWGGSPLQRAQTINDFFKDESTKIIWCLRGGFASISVIEHLDFETIKNNKKLLIGYSDITIIQLALLAKADLPSIQFYMPGTKNWLRTKLDMKYLEKILTGKNYTSKITEKQIIRKGNASAQITGGCLDLIASTLGTSFEIDTENKILFLEDANIPADRFYNLLYTLKFANKLNNLKGLIIGKIHNCKEYKKYLKLFLKDLKKTTTYPIITEYNAGHTVIKIPIPIGGNCKIDSEKRKVSFSFPKEFKEFLPNTK